MKVADLGDQRERDPGRDPTKPVQDVDCLGPAVAAGDLLQIAVERVELAVEPVEMDQSGTAVHRSRGGERRPALATVLVPKHPPWTPNDPCRIALQAALHDMSRVVRRPFGSERSLLGP